MNATTKTKPAPKPTNGEAVATNGAKQEPSQALIALQQIAQALPTCCVPVAQHQQLRQCVEVVARELDRLEQLAEEKE